MIKSLSVFFPSFNEEKNITSTVEKAVAILEGLKIEDYEVLIINDGSTDQTLEVADDLAQKYSKVKVINQPNGGYGMALRKGFETAKYDWIVYTDADGQFDFSQVNKFIEKTDTADYMVGVRTKRQDPFYRSIFSKIWAVSVFLLFGLWLKDMDCGFKMISKKVLEKIEPLESKRGAMINAELAIKVKKNGFGLAQVEVHHYPRISGQPTGASIRVITQSYLDLLKLWWKLK